MVEEIAPDIIFAFDSERYWRLARHPDHIAVGEAVADIVRRRRGHKPRLVCYASRASNAIIDISSTMDSKIASLRCHQSQLRFTPKLYDHFIKRFARYNAKNTIIKEAETFRIAEYWE